LKDLRNNIVIRILLKVGDKLDLILSRRAKLRGLMIGDTEKLQGIIVDPPLYILADNAIDLNLPIHSLKGHGTIVVSQVCRRYLYGDQLGFIVLLPVQSQLQLPACPVLHKTVQRPVSHRVEKEYSH